MSHYHLTKLRLRRQKIFPTECWILDTIINRLRNFTYAYEIDMLHEDLYGCKIFYLSKKISGLIEKGILVRDPLTHDRKPYIKVTQEGYQVIDNMGREFKRSIEKYATSRWLFKRYKGTVAFDENKDIYKVTLIFRRLTFFTILNEATKNKVDVIDFCFNNVLIGSGLDETGHVKNVEENKRFENELLNPDV